MLASKTKPNAEWFARDLQPIFGYSQWRRLAGVILRGRNLIASGEASGQIVEVTRPVSIGSGATRHVVDYQLDAAAVGLIQKLTVAFKLNDHYPVRNEPILLRLLGKYCTSKSIPFQFQARVGEHVFDGLVNGEIVVEIDEPHHAEGGRTSRRDRDKDAFALSKGFTVLRFTLLNDIVDIILGVERVLGDRTRAFRSAESSLISAGYRGLYAGLPDEAIKTRKGIPKSENLMDRMDTTELAANQFRMTQAREKLARDRVNDQQQAIRKHEEVGKEVRAAIQRSGGTMPENIKPAEHIKDVQKRLKNATPKLELDEKDAKGLIGGGGEQSAGT